MQLLAPQYAATSFFPAVVKKASLEDADLRAVSVMVRDSIREGLYHDIITDRTEAGVLEFLRTLATKCEISRPPGFREKLRARVAALVVYTVKNSIVGYAIIAEEVSQTLKPTIELLMVGVAASQRATGYGAVILNNIIREVSTQYFHLIVRCPTDNNLLFAMLAARGFAVLGKYCRGRVMCLRADQKRATGARKPRQITALAGTEPMQSADLVAPTY